MIQYLLLFFLNHYTIFNHVYCFENIRRGQAFSQQCRFFAFCINRQKAKHMRFEAGESPGDIHLCSSLLNPEELASGCFAAPLSEFHLEICTQSQIPHTTGRAHLFAFRRDSTVLFDNMQRKKSCLPGLEALSWKTGTKVFCKIGSGLATVTATENKALSTEENI